MKYLPASTYQLFFVHLAVIYTAIGVVAKVKTEGVVAACGHFPQFIGSVAARGLHGSVVRLRDAKKAAREQIGESVTIFSNKTGDIVCFAPASGYCPP